MCRGWGAKTLKKYFKNAMSDMIDHYTGFLIIFVLYVLYHIGSVLSHRGILI